MEPGQLLFALLSQAAPVRDLLDYAPKPGQAVLRVYPLRAPENTPLPYVLYQVISQNTAGGENCDLDDTARVQLSLFAQSYAQVCQLSQVCRQALHRLRIDSLSIELDQQIDQYSDQAICFFRTQDYLLEGLEANLQLPEGRLEEEGLVRVLETP